LYNIVRLNKDGGYDMKLRIVLEPSDDGGYTVTVPSLPGCISEGDSRKEALNNIKEAIELYLEPVEDDYTFSKNAEEVEIAV
jgi:predicted RNase H-like HicB family nuclease